MGATAYSTRQVHGLSLGHVYHSADIGLSRSVSVSLVDPLVDFMFSLVREDISLGYCSCSVHN
jgi:hypothetical protein